MSKFRDLGFSRDQLVMLGEVYDALGVKKKLKVIEGDKELSWAQMFHLEKIADLRLATEEQGPATLNVNNSQNQLHLMPTAQRKSIGEEQVQRIQDVADSFRKREEMEEYLDYIETGSVYFDEIILEEKVRQNILLDTITRDGDVIRMDLTCCNSANPGSHVMQDQTGAQKLVKYFDNDNHLFLQAVILSSLSLFINLSDSGERSSEQGILVEQLLNDGYDPIEVKKALLAALDLKDRTLLSAGAKTAVIRAYSGSILRKNTSVIEHATGRREVIVPGWNMTEICISRVVALNVVHAYFIEGNLGKIALLLACGISDERPTFTRMFIDLCAIWLVDFAQKNTLRVCEKGGCFACEDTPLCYGEIFPCSTLSQDLRPHFDQERALTIDLLLSRAASSLSFRIKVGESIRHTLQSLFRAQSELDADSSAAGIVNVNIGLSKIGAVMLFGDELDLELLTIVSPQGAEATKARHILDDVSYRSSYILESLGDFCREDYNFFDVRVHDVAAEATFGTIPAKTEEMKRFVQEHDPISVGRWGSFKRLWQEGMYHLSLSDCGLQVSMFPHREGGVSLWSFSANIGSQNKNVDLHNLRKLAQGAFGPAIIEDIIEHHELGNIQIPSTSYSCFVRSRSNRSEPIVQSLRPVNLQNSPRFATDGKKLWYNFCGNDYVRCARRKGQWTFLYDETCKRKSKMIHVQPTKRMIISARWTHQVGRV